MSGTRKNPTLATSAQTDLAKAKRNHTKAQAALDNVPAKCAKLFDDAEARVEQTREALRAAARAEAAKAPDLTPEKRAQLRSLLK